MCFVLLARGIWLSKMQKQHTGQNRTRSCQSPRVLGQTVEFFNYVKCFYLRYFALNKLLSVQVFGVGSTNQVEDLVRLYCQDLTQKAGTLRFRLRGKSC